MLMPKPNYIWNAPKALLQREIGFGAYAGRKQARACEFFGAGFHGSLFSAQKLELLLKLKGHNHYVNCLHFNHSGTRLASGSDDLHIKIWNHTTGKCLTSFHSGHRANVFQAKFLPHAEMDTTFVSSGGDCQIRLNELAPSAEGKYNIWASFLT